MNNHLRTRIKICGMTRQSDALHAVEAGADALGFVFWQPSKRYISPDKAARMIDCVSAYVTTVAVFVDPSSAEVCSVLDHTAIDSLQFHGQETAAFCQQFGRPYVKALAMREGQDVAEYCRRYPQAAGVLLDTYRAGMPGGTGESFQWQVIPADLPRPVILAGGLTPQNIAHAIRTVRPYAVDVSSGVESAPGHKESAKLQALVCAVRDADARALGLEDQTTGEQP